MSLDEEPSGGPDGLLKAEAPSLCMESPPSLMNVQRTHAFVDVENDIENKTHDCKLESKHTKGPARSFFYLPYCRVSGLVSSDLNESASASTIFTKLTSQTILVFLDLDFCFLEDIFFILSV